MLNSTTVSVTIADSGKLIFIGLTKTILMHITMLRFDDAIVLTTFDTL